MGTGLVLKNGTGVINLPNNDMTQEDLIKIEQTIKKKLPDFYKNFLLNYPETLVNLGAPYNTVSELHLPNTAEGIIEISDFENPPQNVLVIGVDGLGNCYYILPDNKDTKIYLFNHEAPEFLDDSLEVIDWHNSWELSYNNLDEFIKDLNDKFKT